MLGALEKQASILLKTSLPVVNNRALKKRVWRRTGLEMFARLLFAQFCFLVRHDLTDLLRLRIAVGIGLRLVHSRRRHSCEHDSRLLTRLLALLCCVALPCRNAALRFSGSARRSPNPSTRVTRLQELPSAAKALCWDSFWAPTGLQAQKRILLSPVSSATTAAPALGTAPRVPGCECSRAPGKDGGSLPPHSPAAHDQPPCHAIDRTHGRQGDTDLSSRQRPSPHSLPPAVVEEHGYRGKG